VKRRLGTAALAILLALLGTVGVLGYVHQADVRALAGQKAKTVLVAAQTIPAGTSAGTAQSRGWLKREAFPAASLPAGVLGSLPASLSSLVLDAQLPAGELLQQPMLVRAVQTYDGIVIPNGKVVTSVTLCLAQAVAGFIQPGSEVTVFQIVGTGTITQSSCNPTTQPLKNPQTRIALYHLLVVAVGPAPSPGSSAAAKTGLGQVGSAPSAQTTIVLTVAATPQDTEKLFTLEQTGLFELALEPPGSQVGVDGSAGPPANPAGG
jgi:pilus assembly protein CpaB